MIPHEDKLIIAKHVIKILNEAFEEDPVAIHAMICHQMPCNDKLKDHPSIQVDLVLSFILSDCVEYSTPYRSKLVFFTFS